MDRVSTKQARTEYPRVPGYTRERRDSISCALIVFILRQQ